MKLNKFDKTVIISGVLIIGAILVFIVIILSQQQALKKEYVKEIIMLQADNWLLRIENKDNETEKEGFHSGDVARDHAGGGYLCGVRNLCRSASSSRNEGPL